MKLKIIFIPIIIFSLGFIPNDDSQKLSKIVKDDNSKYTKIGNIGLTITNFGMYGHGFTLWPAQPSCEYPKGSGIEHLFDGGLWVGGFVDGQVRVTTASVDASTVGARGGGFEFTNSAESYVIEKSSLLNSKYYRPEAISHQDFIAEYADTSTKLAAGEPIPDHIPLGIAVRQESYAWNFPFADFFVIMNYWIKNVSSKRIDSVYVSLWTDAVVRNTNVTSPRTGGPFYAHGGNGYIDSMRMAYEFDFDGDPGFSDSYLGIKYLGSNPKKDSAYFQSWQFRNTSDPIYFAPQDDNQRYNKMSQSLARNRIDPLRTTPSNRSVMISTGPFSRINPGDSINVTFAIICAKKYGPDLPRYDTEIQRKNFYVNANWAQLIYSTNYRFPEPPTTPHLRVVSEDRKVTLYWDKSAEESIDPLSKKKDFEGYRIYRTNAGSDLTQAQDLQQLFIKIAEFDSTGNNIGYNTGFNYIQLPSAKTFKDDTTKYYYKYEFDNLLNGWQYIFSVTGFDKGDPENNIDILEGSQLVNASRVLPGTSPTSKDEAEIGVYPNPYYANAIWDGPSERQRKIYFYNLPESCEITIYTLSGDIVKVLRHDQNYRGNDIRWFQTYSKEGNQILSGGEHAWDLISNNDQAIATGLYLFTVKDNLTNKIKTGKFLIIK
ncbi:MAG: hypothetical protein FJ213_05460 [Ignavibacteria bacterium]|nr:hypothetical protein [Ignavibacteria bacterium]